MHVRALSLLQWDTLLGHAFFKPGKALFVPDKSRIVFYPTRWRVVVGVKPFGKNGVSFGANKVETLRYGLVDGCGFGWRLLRFRFLS